jgi:hypothetical protein
MENSPQRAAQIEQEAKQQTTSPRREIQAAEPATLPTRRSDRNAPKQARFGYDSTQGGGYVAQATGAPYAELDEKLASDMKEIKEATLVKGFLNTVYCYLGIFEPRICKASTKDPDIISYDKAMTDTDNKEEWKKSMAQETLQLEDHGTWEQVPISDSKTKILPLTWVLRRKRSSDGEIKKLKARIWLRTRRPTGRRLRYLCPCCLLDLCSYLFDIVDYLPLDDMQYRLLECSRSSHVKRTCLDSSASRFPVKRSQHLPAHETFHLRFKLCTPSLVGAYLEGA